MNLREALQALLDGKKIRIESWPKYQYIMLYNNMILDHNNDPFYIDNKQRNSWELYPEYDMSFAEALSWMSLSHNNACYCDKGVCFMVKNNKLYGAIDNYHHSSHRWMEHYFDVSTLLRFRFKKVEK